MVQMTRLQQSTRCFALGSADPDVLPSWRLQTSTVDISLSVAAYSHL